MYGSVWKCVGMCGNVMYGDTSGYVEIAGNAGEMCSDESEGAVSPGLEMSTPACLGLQPISLFPCISKYFYSNTCVFLRVLRPIEPE